jgi:CheY-like chemotaxis protein
VKWEGNPLERIPSAEYVRLRVTDTGTGMTDEVKKHLFEAFFTTKPSGQGTGLGLATCRTIVHQCGGHIRVSSEVGRGTTFEIYFPKVDSPGASPEPAMARPPVPKGNETLLVVEDEPSLRHLAQKILESQGYQVLVACNGEEALQIVQDHRGTPIALILTDVIMPIMGGKIMAERIKASHREIKILFTSGYTEDAIQHHGVRTAELDFLPKPYAPAFLARKVREMLDRDQGP